MKESDTRRALTLKPMIVLIYKENFLITNELNLSLHNLSLLFIKIGHGGCVLSAVPSTISM